MLATLIIIGSIVGVLGVYWFGVRFAQGVARSDEFEARVRARHRRDRG